MRHLIEGKREGSSGTTAFCLTFKQDKYIFEIQFCLGCQGLHFDDCSHLLHCTRQDQSSIDKIGQFLGQDKNPHKATDRKQQINR